MFLSPSVINNQISDNLFIGNMIDGISNVVSIPISYFQLEYM